MERRLAVSFKTITAASLFCAMSIGLSVKPAHSADMQTVIASISSVSDVDARQASIEKRLADAYSAGRISQVQMEGFKRDLARVAEQEAVFRASDSSLSLWETLRLQFSLDEIVKQLEGSLTDRQNGFVDVYSRRDEITKRLADAYAQGRLTAQEYSQIHMELDNVNRGIQQATPVNGQIGVTDSIKLVLELDRISQNLTRTVHDRQVSMTAIDVKQSDIQKKINEGKSSGKLTDAEVTTLQNELNRIIANEDALRKTGRPLTAEEQLTLALDLEKLSGEVSVQYFDSEVVQNVGVDVAKRRLDVDRNLAQALASGLLTLTEAQLYKDELDVIARKEETYKTASNGQIDIMQAQNLLIDLERLNGKIDRAVVNTKPVWIGINATIEDMSKKITDAKAGQRLSDIDEVVLRGSLDKIIANKATYAATAQGYDAQEAISLASDLTKLQGLFFRTVKDREITVIPDLTKRKGEINKRISEGTVTGQLTADETRSLLEDFDRINSREAAFKAADGLLDEREKLSIALDLERLAGRVEKESRDNPYVSKTIQARKEQADQAISAGSVSGKLSAQEAQDLRNEYNRILSFEVASRTSDGNLDAKEALTIALDLDRLLKDADAQMKNSETALPDLAKREAELYQRITEGVMQGRLTAGSADILKRDFYRLLDMEAKYRASGGLSFGEHAALALELEKLSSNIETNMRSGQAALPDVDARQAQIDSKLAEAVASGRLSADQAREFTRELDRISRDEVTYRFSGSGLSYAESLSLITDLEKLSAKLETKLAGNSGQWKGIDGRISETSARISDALLSRKIDIRTANQFKNELDRINQAKSAFMSSGGGLNFSETESLVRDLDKVARDVDNRLGTGKNLVWTDIDGRQARIEARLNSDLASGKISSQTANKAKRELTTLKVVKAAFKNSDGGYSYSELVSLAQQLDKISRLVGVPVQMQ